MTLTGSPVRVGVVGAGYASQEMHLPVLVNLPNIRVAWICDTDASRARAVAKQFSVKYTHREIDDCDDVDLALVAIPVGNRSALMPRVLARGWHVFCEKPVALSVAELDGYLDQAKARNLEIGVGLLRRFWDVTILARTLVRSGVFGPIRRVWASEGKRTKRTGREESWYVADPIAVGGGVLNETGSHLTDQVCRIVDARAFVPKDCQQVVYEELDFHTRANGNLVMEDERTVDCTIEVSRLEDLCEGIFLQFQHCIIRCQSNFSGRLDILDLSGTTVASFPTGLGSWSVAFVREWRAFLDQCESGQASEVDARTVRPSVGFIEMCYKTAKRTTLGSDPKGLMKI